MNERGAAHNGLVDPLDDPAFVHVRREIKRRAAMVIIGFDVLLRDGEPGEFRAGKNPHARQQYNQKAFVVELCFDERDGSSTVACVSPGPPRRKNHVQWMPEARASSAVRRTCSTVNPFFKLRSIVSLAESSVMTSEQNPARFMRSNSSGETAEGLMPAADKFTCSLRRMTSWQMARAWLTARGRAWLQSEALKSEHSPT